MEVLKMENKLGLKQYLAYGIGQAGDTIPYCMFYTYFVFFLTDVVGISPAVAGAVSLIAVCWDGITDPIIGYLSDRTKNPSGRRRPWMIKSLVPLALLVFLIFAPFEIPSKALATTYYVIIAVLFWTLYTTYVIPYASLAAEMTDSYKERYNLRVANMICGGLFMLMCSSGPMVVWQWGIDHGMSDKASWGFSGIIFGAITLLFGFLCWIFTKGTEQKASDELLENNRESIFTTIKETMSMKPYRMLCFGCLVFFLGDVAGYSATVYLLTYNCGMTAGQQTIFWLVYSIAYTAMVPVGGLFVKKFGKKKALLIGMAFMTALSVFFFIIKVDSFMKACILYALVMFGACMVWTTYFAFAYDCAELDEYKHGKRREGSLVAIVSFAQKLGSAIGTYTIGIMLAAVGYDAGAAEQSSRTLLGILSLSTLLPALGALLVLVIMAKYPINQKEYDYILKANADKKAGNTVDESGFKNCLN